MKKLLLALIVAGAAPAALAEVWVNPGFYSHHFDKSKNLNNSNHGLGVEATINHTYSLTAGVFENSNRATSHYIGAYVMPQDLAEGQWRWLGPEDLKHLSQSVGAQ